MHALEMDRSSLGTLRKVEEAFADPAPGQALIAPRRFALTANNVTYAVFGDMLNYWSLFPTEGMPWGRVPVWGFAEVVASRVDGLREGERLYGYLPMAQRLLIEPVRPTAHAVDDGMAHRQNVAPAYNRYQRVTDADADTENRICLLKPLFITGWLLDEWIATDEAFCGCRHVLASSASSKTALAMAAGLKARGGFSVTGLTSKRSAAFVMATGFYDRIVTYDDIGALDVEPGIYVDFAGDPAITGAVHNRFADKLVKSVMVGGAHWDADRSNRGGSLPGPQPEMFFAPTHMGRIGDSWGGAKFMKVTDEALAGFVAGSRAWLHVNEVSGLDAASGLWQRLLANDVLPSEGLTVTL
jgi:hypothetical protein